MRDRTELPEGVPVGTNVAVKVRVEGYFFKLQGYQPGNAKPNRAPLKAPMLIGRVKQIGTPNSSSASAGNDWLYMAAGGFLLLSMIFTVTSLIVRRRARTHRAKLDACKIDRGAEWLSRGDLPIDEKSLPQADRDNAAEEGFDFLDPRKPS